MYELEGECDAKYVRPDDFTQLGITESDVIPILDEMTERVEPYYVITCPDCCNETAVVKNIPTQVTVYVCDCGVKFELKMEHISLVYKIKKTV